MPFVPVRRPQTEASFIPRALSHVKIDAEAYDRGGTAFKAVGQALTSASQTLEHAAEQQERDKAAQALTTYEQQGLTPPGKMPRKRTLGIG